MPDCPLLTTCPFFTGAMAEMPAASEMLKVQYCKGEYKQCARYMIATGKGREHVPPNLGPSQSDRARKILKS